MKSRNIFLKGLLCILLPVLGSVQAWGDNHTYYAKAKANIATSSTGAGTVYASASSTNNPTYGNGNTVSKSQNNNQDFTFYMYAQPNAGSEFTGWSTTTNGTEITGSNTNPYRYSVTSSTENENNATINSLYAVFKILPTFYFRASATVTPAGAGTASTSPTTTSARGAHWNSTSATATSNYTASANSNYHFMGWSSTSDGSIVSTDNPYIATITSTSTTQNSPTITTYYARFQPYPTSITATPATIILGSGDTSDPIDVTVSPEDAWKNLIFISNNSNIATVDANGAVTAGNVAETTTITIQAVKDDGTTVVTSTSVTIIVKAKCAAPEFEIVPAEDGNTATVSISTSTQAPVSIYYTTNGNDPTTQSTLYTAPFTVTNGQTIKAFAVKQDYYDSNISSATFTAVKVATPTINIDQSNITFSCATQGASFYYTTDGSTPTTDLTPWNGAAITNLTDGTTIKVIAVKTGMIDSDVATETYHTPTGVSGTTVTLNDLEKHDWSYYSDPDCPIRSLSPADVKITYYGNGIMMKNNNNYTANTSANNYINSSNDDWTSPVAVGITNAENQNTIVYLKTLERAANTTTAWTFSSDNQSQASARCAYTTIPNPFQKRPTYQTNNDTKWRGFQCWRLKSVTNGNVFSASSGGTALSTNAIINAETEIYFAPDSEYGMEVELEAVWARAYVVSSLTTNGNGNNRTYTYNVTDQNVGYERNFIVIEDGSNTYNIGSGNRSITNTNNRAFTISGYYPNGTVGNANATFMNADNTLTADTKIENIKLGGGSNTLTAAGHNLIIGRGCTGSVNLIRGMAGNSSDPVDYAIRVESGTYNSFALIDNTARTFSGIISTRAIIGCDYDRANNNNERLSVAPNGIIYGGNAGHTFSNASNRNNITYDWIVKSGKVQGNKTISGGDAEESLYLGNSITGDDGAQYMGKRRLTIEGGEVASIAGGVNSLTAATYGVNDNTWTVMIRIKGGTVRGAIYGAAAFGGASGDRKMILTGGQVNGWIAGGCNGTATTGGLLLGNTYIYVGGDANVGNSTGGTKVGTVNYYNSTQRTYGDNGADGGHIFGAGCGILPRRSNNGAYTDGWQTATVGKVNNSTIAISDNAHVWRDVHGGGNYGWVEDNGTATIFIGGNSIIGGIDGYGNVFGGSNNQQGQEVNITVKGGDVKGGVYGGSHSWGTINDNVTMNISGGLIEQGAFGGGYGTAQNSCDVTGTSTINMTGGTVLTGLYGGGNVNSKINGKTTVNVNGGTIGASATPANVYGGGLGAATRAKGDVEVNIGSINNNVTSGDAVIYGDVYGGSAKGVTNCNDAGTARNGNTTTNVTLNGGTIHGSLYGGGHGIEGATANVWGPVTVVVNGGSVKQPLGNPGSIFGCNNEAGTPKNTVTVTINKTDATTTVDGVKRYAINGVYGGGNLAHYDPENPGKYPTVTINGCSSSIKDVYGGGNAAAVPYTNVTINGGDIYRVFAGGNGESGTANVGYKSTSTTNSYGAGTAQAHIYGGTIYQVFGGSNTNGVIREGSSIEIDKSKAPQSSDCDMIIQEVYGGGNKANGNACSLTIGCTGELVAGANGHAANPDNIGKTLEGIGAVYGGANQANIGTQNSSSDITLTINSGMVANVFGGNNTSGTVYGDITVNIDKTTDSDDCGWYVGNVFGGGNNAAYPGDPEVNIKNGDVSLNVFGGGKGQGATVTGNPVVTIGASGKTVTIAGNVYGGGDAAPVDGNTLVTIDHGSTIGTKVFGGGNQAGVTGNATVLLTSGIIGNTAVQDVYGGIYGGCYTSGTIGGNSSITVLGGTVGTDSKHANIHGGGYGQLTGVSGNVTVNIGQSGSTAGATIYGDIYGGSALGTVNTDHSGGGTYNKTAVNLYGGTIDGNVYGGGLGDENVAAIVYGDVDVLLDGAALVAKYSENLPSSGMIFGCNNVNGTPKGHVKVIVYKTTGIDGIQERSTAANRATTTESDHTYELSAVFGGGNHAAYVPDDLDNGYAEVFINGCDDVSINSVYGGGNAASTPATDVIVQGAYEIEYVFGGGNGAGTGNPGANVGYYAYPDNISGSNQVAAREGYKYGSGKAQTGIFGGRIHKVFGGSNTKGNVRTATVAMLDEKSDCKLEMDGFYGGGKSAYMEGKTQIELGCISGLDEIYGGAEQADVGSHVVLTLTSGHYNKVYGGNNLGGKILGSITVNIEQTGCLPIEIGELYLGGNNAPYSVYGYDDNGIIRGGTKVYPDPVMNLRSFKSIGTVFGGGEGAGAELAGDPTINVNVATGWVDGQYMSTDNNDPNSQYHAAPQALTPDGVIGTIFGGGNAAQVTGNTTINIGDQSTVEMHSLSAIKERIDATQEKKLIMGGIVFELSDDKNSIKYTVQGQPTPAMTQPIIQTVNGANITGNVYGGGNQADVTGGTTINVGQ
ncbi:MAG: chitobiase/beta-hexosaminidase C-terminal domain-containing protein [Bacteroidaceae bacterium]|nr:chitobiase/beta-hexosaminidase C-terminal domain-containing protein [Bacteroidaceae bacterium]